MYLSERKNIAIPEMLERLSIENYALIQQLELELSPSLNIITGETGAGKSILLGALGLIMGNRADTAVLKDSGRNCVIEGLFDMGGYGLETFFDENELDYFEIKMTYNELTSDYVLEITDFAEPDEVDDMKELWESQVAKLRRTCGF